MEDRKLTGNKMFEMVKDECERALGKGEGKVKKKRGGGLYWNEKW